MPSNVVNVPMNRVEGDLEIKVELEDGIVRDAWSTGTMFRGFENIMKGRGALDGLVITPRICGLCSATHLTAAAKALDMISGANVPDDAIRIRNVALMSEHIQSDIRHGFLMFTVDFANPVYKAHGLYGEAVKRYAPLKGSTALEVFAETKKVLEIVALLGGQWPHSSFMVPGGVVSVPGASDILQCRHILSNYRKWYEKKVLGCSIDRWSDVTSAAALDKWLDESEDHRDSELGFYIRFAREAGLEKSGAGHGNFLSYGSLDMPRDTAVESGGDKLVPSGFAKGTKVGKFDQANIAEHVAHSWFRDYGGGRHPMDGETVPYATGNERGKYSWAKAPRYDGMPAETGPLAEMVVAGDPLFTELVGAGPSVYARELARLVRPATLMPAMDVWLSEIAQNGDKSYEPPGEIVDGEGYGLVEATRGALGHWVKIRNSRIEHYQVVTPTAWHASPRDSDGVRGPFEECLVGTKVADPENPVELGHVIRSHDACLVCTVHAIEGGRKLGRMRISF
jgi:uptake hydrogenase large subunit